MASTRAVGKRFDWEAAASTGEGFLAGKECHFEEEEAKEREEAKEAEEIYNFCA